MSHLINKTLLLALVLLAPVTALEAETVLRTGSDISVGLEQVVEGDYYVSSGLFSSSVMSGLVEEDMYGFGAVITVNGEVGEDATLAAGTVHMHGPVGDDLRVLAGEVTLAEPVGGDVFIMGGVVKVLSTATIGGDVFVFGGDVQIESEVAGSIFGQVEHFTLASAVGGDVEIEASTGVVLSEGASIGGDLQYESLVPLARAPGSVVEGEVHKGQSNQPTAQEELRTLLIPLFISLFTILSLYLLFKPQLIKVVDTMQHESAKSLLVGIVALVAGPVLAIILLVSVLGVFVGLAFFAGLLLLYVVTLALTGAALGVLLLRLMYPKTQLSLVPIVVGTVLLHALVYVPYIGILIIFVLLAMGMGAILLLLYRAATE